MPLPQPSAPEDAPFVATPLDGLGKPLQAIPYCDVIRGWLPDPLQPAELTHLQGLCTGKLDHKNRKPRFRRDNRPHLEYQQALIVRQPTRAALDYLTERRFMLNYSEFALDRFYGSMDGLRDALQFVLAHALIKNRGDQRVRVCFGLKGFTLYTGERDTPHLSVTYADKKSKVAKSAIPPLHDERRTKGARAHQRRQLGLMPDPTTFWRENQRFCYVADVEGLGRAYNNAMDGDNSLPRKSRRKPLIKKITDRISMNIDLRMGHQLIRTVGQFRPEQLLMSKEAEAAGCKIEDLPGYWSIRSVISIQNLYDRLHPIIPMDRFIRSMDVDGNSDLAC
ncbi:hypothetical protein IVB45_01455 [Bradyrhizobium sp. 4]|uniref:hypothetical protein n=1 Tax=unclassified Bradyrhizobium TaxID=2631580 RepID=UPI001FFAAF39|nr:MULTISPECIES: hypothetical protein [unclassified Bradyrhizobium]MCK1403598.1 hypothetical protein [Bradyrhizobium sp. 39]MCK1746793.1 hypothetical protein [Bradyrhizobium sp. 135]UPJ35708.1 hypothetical protein IVB45_01455 [Bradyrhizobium sp. 4]